MSDTVNSNNFQDFHKVFVKYYVDRIQTYFFCNFNQVFDGRLNPNGCPIRGTFFVAHEYSNYHLVQQVHHEGHEIATYSIR